MKDSPCESSVVTGLQEQIYARRLQGQEPAHLVQAIEAPSGLLKADPYPPCRHLLGARSDSVRFYRRKKVNPSGPEVCWFLTRVPQIRLHPQCHAEPGVTMRASTHPAVPGATPHPKQTPDSNPLMYLVLKSAPDRGLSRQTPHTTQISGTETATMIASSSNPSRQ